MSAHIHAIGVRGLVAVAVAKAGRTGRRPVASQDWGELSLGRVCSLLGIMVLLFWPIASCGSADIAGIHVLRNEGPLSDVDIVHTGGLRAVYAAIVACAVTGALLCESALVSLLAGAGGVILLAYFLLSLKMLLPGMEFRYGAYVALLCFGGLLVHAGLQASDQRGPRANRFVQAIQRR